MTISSDWMVESIASLPTTSEATFAQLWDDNRIKFQNGSNASDEIDRANARLASSTLERRLQLLIVLPDESQQRAPLLFGSALVSQWWNRRVQGLPAGKVIYFGTTIGIREHLSRVRVGRLQLSDVFPQSKASSGSANHGKVQKTPLADNPSLPEVVTAYSPSDPYSLLESYRPVWIAIDCGSEGHIRWLPQLLVQARAEGIPVIAWSHNPLSEVTRYFEAAGQGQVIRWPFALSTISGPSINPIVVEVNDDDIMFLLQSAYRNLARATASSMKGRLLGDALNIAWRIQRQLEQLTVPFDLFESEANNYWGIQSIRRLVSGTQRFLSELRLANSPIVESLAETLSCHEQVIEMFQDGSPPLWDALSQLCIEDTNAAGDQQIVFSSKARKQMFSLALLSRFNISEDDLSQLGVSLSSLTELKDRSFAQSPNSIARSGSALLAGLPSIRLSAKMMPLMSLQALGVLILPFQENALFKWVRGLRNSLDASPANTKAVIEARAGRIQPYETPKANPTLILGQSRRLTLGTSQVLKTKARTPIVPELDAAAEVSWYMDDYDEQEYEIGSTGSLQNEVEDVWIHEAIEIQATGGWHGFFAPEEKLNVILEIGAGRRTEERFVRSVRAGDRILIIHGQKRQSLYDLVISRVHNHPAMEIHLALIGKWQEELAESFRARRREGWTADDVLARIQEHGSLITSTQTIRLWVLGQVLAPEDPKDLLRLAKSMDMQFVEMYHARINNAARRIRGLHRGLSTRLNRWLKEQVSNAVDADLEIFDDELGLSFQDFRDSLEVHTVERSESVNGIFLRERLGTFEREVKKA